MEEVFYVVLGPWDPSSSGFHPGHPGVLVTPSRLRLATQFSESALVSGIGVSSTYPREIYFLQCHDDEISERARLPASSSLKAGLLLGPVHGINWL